MRIQKTHSHNSSYEQAFMSIKIAVVLQQGEKITRKPWRFNPSDISSYRLTDVEEDILRLFPDVAKRDCKLTFHYKDSLVGDVELESDRDLQDSLQSFTEESDVQYKTFFVTEKRKPVHVSTPSAASSDPIVSPKAKRRKLPDQSIPKEKMENTLANAEKEIGLPDNEQPLYIDVDDGLIKCKWCGKNFSGSQQMRCINQHVRKSATHRQARKKFLPSNGSNRMEDQNVSGINDGGDQTEHDYIQMYMHPKPSDCNQSVTDDNADESKRSSEENDQDVSDHAKLGYVQDIIEVYLNTEMQDDNSHNSFAVTDGTSKCYGIYDAKCVELLGSKQRHRAEELWTQGRNNETDSDCHIIVQCVCCNTYDNWQSMHPDEHKLLQECATKQEVFEFYPHETVVVLENGIPVEYMGIVHSTGCTGTATGSGDHSHQCTACYTLMTTTLPQECDDS